jgi:hypothetical protein
LEAQIHEQRSICGNMTRSLRLGLKPFTEGVRRWFLKAPWDKE